MEVILINPGSKIISYIFNKNKFTPESATEWMKQRYRRFEIISESPDEIEISILEKKHRGLYNKDYKIMDFAEGVKAKVVDIDTYENPRKVTPEIRDFVIQKYVKEKFTPKQVQALLREKFGIYLSPSTIRNIGKGIEGIGEINKKEVKDMARGLPSSIMREAMDKYKKGDFASKSEAISWAWEKARESGISDIGASPISRSDIERVVNEILINRGERRRKGGIKTTDTTARETFTELSKKFREAWLKSPELKRIIREAAKEAWETAAGKALRERLRKEIRDLWETKGEKIKKELRKEIKPLMESTWRGRVGSELKGKLSREISSELSDILKRAWASPEGQAMIEELKKALGEKWETLKTLPEFRTFYDELGRTIKRIYGISAYYESGFDEIAQFGFLDNLEFNNLLFIGAGGVLEPVAHTLLSSIFKIVGVKDATVNNLLSGIVNYTGSAFLLNTMRVPTPLKYAYLGGVVRDTFGGMITGITDAIKKAFPTQEISKIENKSTSDMGSTYALEGEDIGEAIVNINQLELDEEGNLIVPETLLEIEEETTTEEEPSLFEVEGFEEMGG